jgi:replication-associated recombination protein RarA
MATKAAANAGDLAKQAADDFGVTEGASLAQKGVLLATQPLGGVAHTAWHTATEDIQVRIYV